MLQQYDRLEELLLREDNEEANRIADSILNLAPKVTTEHDFLLILYDKGKAMEFQTLYVQSLNIYQDLLNRSERAGDHYMQALSYLSIARIYDNLSRQDKFLDNIQHAESVIDQYDLDYLRAELYIRYASYHRYFGEKDSSLYYTKRAIFLANKYKIKKLIPDGYLMLGHLSNDNQDKISNYQKAASLFSTYKNNFGAASQYLNVATLYQREADYDRMKANLDSAKLLIYSKQSTSLEKYSVRARYLDLVSQYFSQIGNSDSALRLLILSNIYKDSANMRGLSDRVLKYEVDIARLKEKQQKNDLKTRSNFLLIGLITASLIALLLWWFLRKNTSKNNIILKKNNVILIQNKELENLLIHQKKLLSEVHHRVKNNLQLVISLMAIKSNASDNKQFKEDLEDLANKIQSMSLIHEQLYRVGEFSVINIFQYLTDISNYFKDILKNDLPVDIRLEVEKEINLNIETTLPLGIIIVELLNNSIKYARPADDHLIIDIKLNNLGSDFMLTYRDNGEEVISKKKGLGSLLIENMSRQLNGKMKYLTTEGFAYTLQFVQKEVSAINFGNQNN